MRITRRGIALASALLLVSVLGCNCRAAPARSGGDGTQGLRVDDLPDHVRAPRGELTLFADYENEFRDDAASGRGAGAAAGRRIALYIVNRTGKTVRLPAQDRDLYIKLEMLGEDGLWERAQTHSYSWCGNSYISVELRDGAYITRPGYFPETGKKAKVRYRAYAQPLGGASAELISNEGEGMVPEGAVLAARHDPMAMKHVPATLRSCFPYSFPEGTWGVTKIELPTLGKLTPRRAAAALALLHSYDRSHYFRAEARRIVAGESDLELTAESAPAVENMRELLKRAWTKRRDRRSLFERTVQAITAPEDGRPPASPESERLVTWCLLQELVCSRVVGGYSVDVNVNYAYYSLFDERAPRASDRLKSALVAECRRVLAKGSDSERGYAASILASRSIGAGLVKARELAGFVRDRQKAVWRWAAVGLAKAGRRDLLVDAARPRTKSEWRHVLYILGVDIPERMGRKEMAFWLEYGEADPATLSNVLATAYRNRTTPDEFKTVIRDYLEDEIATPRVTKTGVQSFYNLKMALQFVDSWGEAEDTPLLKKFLAHPLTEEQHWSNGETKTIRPVRQHVEHLLRDR